MTPATPSTDPLEPAGADPSDLPLFASTAPARPSTRSLAGPGAEARRARRKQNRATGTRPAPVDQATAPTIAEAGPTTTAATSSASKPTAGQALGLTPAQAHTIQDRSQLFDDIDWPTVYAIRERVAELMRERLDGNALNLGMHAETVRDLIDEQIQTRRQDAKLQGREWLTVGEQQRLAEATFDAMFGMGRLSQLLRLDGLENVEIRGCDNVTLLFGDGRVEIGPAIADSDEALLREIQLIAQAAPTGEKNFSQTNPSLEMMLPDGSRMSASGWYAARPSVTIRKHRFVDVDLDDLYAMGMISRGMREFLGACVQAGKTMIISGVPGSGKTTLMRGVINELDPLVGLATIESMFELQLHRMTKHPHPRTWATEAQEGGGDVLANGRRPGQVTMSTLIERALRHNVDRIIVGEVLGPEVMAMMAAMQASKASLSTIHATGANDTVERLVSCIMHPENGQATPDYAYREVATHINLIVFVDVIDETHLVSTHDGQREHGRRHRFVSEIAYLSTNDDAKRGISVEPLFVPDDNGRGMPAGSEPDWVHDLVPFGFDRALLTPGADQWATPMTTKLDYSQRYRTRRGR